MFLLGVLSEPRFQVERLPVGVALVLVGYVGTFVLTFIIGHVEPGRVPGLVIRSRAESGLRARGSDEAAEKHVWQNPSSAAIV